MRVGVAEWLALADRLANLDKLIEDAIGDDMSKRDREGSSTFNDNLEGHNPFEREGYTKARFARENRIAELVDQLRELAETELPGTYSSDAFLQAATALWCHEQPQPLAQVPTRHLSAAQELTEARDKGYGHFRMADPLNPWKGEDLPAGDDGEEETHS